MGKLTYAGKTSVEVLVTKSDLSTLIRIQDKTSLTFGDKLTQPQMVSFLSEVGGFITNFIRSNILSLGADAIFTLASDLSNNELMDVYEETGRTWQYLRDVSSQWNNKQAGTVFHSNTIVKVRMMLPATLYRDSSTGQIVSIFTGANGYMTGAITSSGIEMGS